MFRYIIAAFATLSMSWSEYIKCWTTLRDTPSVIIVCSSVIPVCHLKFCRNVLYQDWKNVGILRKFLKSFFRFKVFRL